MAFSLQSRSALRREHLLLPLGVSPFRSCNFRERPRRCVPELKPRQSCTTTSAGPEDKEPLPWERNEKLKELATEKGELPFGVYLLGASIVAIAAVGSIFEIIYKNPLFGVIPPSSPFWLPILGFFGVTGLPTAGFLFIKAIKSANEESDRQNKADGY